MEGTTFCIDLLEQLFTNRQSMMASTEGSKYNSDGSSEYVDELETRNTGI